MVFNYSLLLHTVAPSCSRSAPPGCPAASNQPSSSPSCSPVRCWSTSSLSRAMRYASPRKRPTHRAAVAALRRRPSQLTNPSDHARQASRCSIPSPTEFAGEHRPIALKLGPQRWRPSVPMSCAVTTAAASPSARSIYRVTGPLGLIQRQGRIDSTAEDRGAARSRRRGGSRDLELALAGARLGGRRRNRPGAARAVTSSPSARIVATTIFATSTGRPRPSAATSSVRQYETERDQRLVIVLDAGRLMRPRIGAYRKLDYAINASIHLAQAALHKGDLIGHAVFDDELRAFAEERPR